MDLIFLDTRRFDNAHFLAKWQGLPDSRFCSGVFHRGSQACALGHCGRFSWKDQTPEAAALEDLYARHFRCTVPYLADGHHPDYREPTQRARLIAAHEEIALEE